jgi:hypothetical protein
MEKPKYRWAKSPRPKEAGDSGTLWVLAAAADQSRSAQARRVLEIRPRYR